MTISVCVGRVFLQREEHEMTHEIVKKENGNYGLKRIASGCVYGDFDSAVEALEAIGQSAAADQSFAADPAQY